MKSEDTEAAGIPGNDNVLDEKPVGHRTKGCTYSAERGEEVVVGELKNPLDDMRETCVVDRDHDDDGEGGRTEEGMT